MDVFMDLLPIIVPFVLGAVAAALAPAFLTSKRLRAELALESEMLDRLPPGARAELRAEVRRRTLVLVSIVRWPPFTVMDLLLLVGLTAALAFGVVIAVTAPTTVVDPPRDYISFLVIIGVAITCWRLFYSDWTRRAAGRLGYIDSKLGGQEAAPVARMLRIGDSIAGFGCLFAIGVVTLVMIARYFQVRPEDVWWILGMAAPAIFAGVVTVVGTDSHGLTVEALRLADPRQFSLPTTQRRERGGSSAP